MKAIFASLLIVFGVISARAEFNLDAECKGYRDDEEFAMGVWDSPFTILNSMNAHDIFLLADKVCNESETCKKYDSCKGKVHFPDEAALDIPSTGPKQIGNVAKAVTDQPKQQKKPIKSPPEKETIVGHWVARENFDHGQFERFYDDSKEQAILDFRSDGTFSFFYSRYIRGYISDISTHSYEGTYTYEKFGLKFNVTKEFRTGIVGADGPVFEKNPTLYLDITSQFRELLSIKWNEMSITLIDSSKAPQYTPPPPPPEETCCGTLWCNQTDPGGSGGGHFEMETCGKPSQAVQLCAANGAWVISGFFLGCKGR